MNLVLRSMEARRLHGRQPSYPRVDDFGQEVNVPMDHRLSSANGWLLVMVS